MIRSVLSQSALSRLILCAPVGAALLLAAHSLPAQTAGATQTLPDQCSGPLAALLPECQAAGTQTNLPSVARPAPTTPTTIQIPGSQPSQVPGMEPSQVPGVQPSREGITLPPTAAVRPAVKPEPPSEFQRFVASSIGQFLPIFGASLFERVPTTFAPVDRIPVTADYVIGPGDEILLRVWGQVDLNLRLPVDRDGNIYILQVGNVVVSGLQFRQLPDYLRSQLSRVFRNFDLSVNMGQLRSIQIFVVGDARRPGTYTVSSLSTLVNALFESGGPSAQGTMRRIQLKRDTQVVTELDLYDLLLKGDKSGDVRLLPQDVVYIPPVGPQIAAAGSLKNPAIYELKDEKTVGELIQMTGGLTAVADRQRATLERIKDGASREVLDLSLNAAGMNVPVADGDVLQVLTIVPRFENTVTLRGNVANPGRFRWHAGMRLRDIIPDKESLLTRDYWKNRNLLSYMPHMEGYTPLEEVVTAGLAGEAQRKPAVEAKSKPKETRIEPAAPDINWSYAVIERQNPRDLTTELIPFDLGKLVLENDEGQNLELWSGDVVTIFSQTDIRVPQLQQTRFVRLEGEFHAPGVYKVGPGETLGQIVQKAGGLTPQAYLYASEFLRESVRQNQQKRLDQYVQDLELEIEQTASTRLTNIANAEESATLAARLQSQRQLTQQLRLVQATGRIVLSLAPGSNDISGIADLSLEDGDRFIVPTRPATVNVLGAVYNPNAFVYAADRTVEEYVQQAGGLTRRADKGRMYILRADGSVLPEQNTDNFEKRLLHPGDSIVAPEEVFKRTFLTNLREWSQVFYQFGLAAAAINVLR